MNPRPPRSTLPDSLLPYTTLFRSPHPTPNAPPPTPANCVPPIRRTTMNAPERSSLLPDIQSRADTRGLALDAVGVKGVRYPVTVRTRAGQLSTIATLSMHVSLTATAKGTHMSRFIEVLDSKPGAQEHRT